MMPDIFLPAWMGAYLVVTFAGFFGSMADLAGRFEQGYNAVPDDLKSGRYPRTRGTDNK